MGALSYRLLHVSQHIEKIVCLKRITFACEKIIPMAHLNYSFDLDMRVGIAFLLLVFLSFIIILHQNVIFAIFGSVPLNFARVH